MAVKYIEKFEKDVQSKLNPDNMFWMTFRGKVTKEKTANIPQYDTEVEADASGTYPLAVVDWTNGNKQVTQQEFKTKAYKIDDLEEFFTAQDERSDLRMSIIEFFDTEIGNYAAYQLASESASTQVITSGTDTRSSSLSGSTNTVYRISKENMIEIRTKMAQSNIKGGSWYGVLDSVQIEDLMSIAEFTEADKLGIRSRLLEGKFADILGIKIFERNPLLGAQVAYEMVGSPVASPSLKNVYGVPGVSADSVAVTDVAAGIFWNNRAIYSLRGLANVYVDTTNKALYQGDLLSGRYTFGCDKAREDEVGVVTIIEGISA